MKKGFAAEQIIEKLREAEVLLGKGEKGEQARKYKDSTRGWNRIICIDPLWFGEDGVLHGKASRAAPPSAPVTVMLNT